eukprot:TRINITY_DN74630_c0_g1_i1.p1 TRINITY_DN74630_c0_g1~~TRINITY_DN74630_c0_g1_i1.p1  ORF type:complete len:134 (-),score=29.59 TRINITY_DN74630_c0_g1_i1:375-776(-)
MEEIKDEPESTEIEESDSDRGMAPAVRGRGGLITDKKMAKADLLLANRLSENRSKDDIHARAKKLKQHYKEVEACDKIMAYGFVIILFLLTGFYWFIMIFREEIRDTFHESHLLAPAFVFGSVALAVLNILFR